MKRVHRKLPCALVPSPALAAPAHAIAEFLKGTDIHDPPAKFGLGTSGEGALEATGAFMRGEQEKWRTLAKELNIEPQ